MNKYQEAIDFFLEWAPYYKNTRSEKLIQELVDKTKPTKPIHKHDLKQFGTCEKCNARVNIRHHNKHCGNCGQALDWSNETE
jgi:NADH pyrophosphatase NudC (nudix superfamily)